MPRARAKVAQPLKPPPPPHAVREMTPLPRTLKAQEKRAVVECDNNLQAVFAGMNEVLNETWKGGVSHGVALMKNIEELPGGRLRFTLSYLTVKQD